MKILPVFILFYVALVRSFEVLTNIRGISIYGLETEHRGFVCDWVQPIEYYIGTVTKLGFNLIRMPMSYQYIKEGDYSKLDHVVSLCKANSLKVMLDMHRIWSWHQGPNPFENGITLPEFTSAWLTMLRRYENETAVIGHNIYNENQGTDVISVKNYSEHVITQVENAFPNRYIYFVTGTRWGGCLMDMQLTSLNSSISKRIYYSVHKYHFSGDGTQKDWDESFGNLQWLSPQQTIIGEFGWDAKEQRQEDWALRFMSYLQHKNITNTVYWTIAHSADTGNLFQDDCLTLNWKHFNLLKQYWDKQLIP